MAASGTLALEPISTAAARLPSAARGGPLSHALNRAARLHRMSTGVLLREVGLFPGQEVLMMILWDEGPTRQSELIRRMNLDPSTITKMLQRLEHAGHVSRFPDPNDGRAHLVAATDESCALHTQVSRVWTQMEEQSLTGLDEGERTELARLLRKVGDNLAGETAHANGPEVCLISGKPLPAPRATGVSEGPEVCAN